MTSSKGIGLLWLVMKNAAASHLPKELLFDNAEEFVLNQNNSYYRQQYLMKGWERE